MKTEFRKLLSIMLLNWTYKVMPECEFKRALAELIQIKLITGMD